MNSGQSDLSFQALKEKQRAIRDGFPPALGLRVHRALSWLQRAELAEGDDDIAFICYWISFNAAYADELTDTSVYGERSAFDNYFAQLTTLDTGARIYSVIWDRYAQAIRLLLENRYVFQPFWKFQNGTPGYSDWERRFQQSIRVTHRALAENDTKVILSTLFDRLYVLRNQLVHGGATWNSSVNRKQLRDGKNILRSLMPLFIDLMMDCPDIAWGEPFYPVVES
ncbi:MAG: hypothetical protein H6994_03715 [Pseudomonadales bacterium]|nr:hypothetical protein [Pseudomonadales bacterium]